MQRLLIQIVIQALDKRLVLARMTPMLRVDHRDLLLRWLVGASMLAMVVNDDVGRLAPAVFSNPSRACSRLRWRTSF
jgi:hypothetical protein